MRKFDFKLKSVEKVRKSRENDALKVLADAQRALSAAKEIKLALLRDLENALIKREGLGREEPEGEPVTQADFKIMDDFILGTKQRIERADHSIQKAERGVEKALRAYLFARRQTRMMEMLREKEYLKYRKERARLEGRNQDDLYIMRFRMDKEEGAA